MIENAGLAMKVRMRADLREAMKAGRTDDAKLIRALIAAIDNAEAPKLPEVRAASDRHRFHDGSAEISRLSLDQDEVRSVLTAELREREKAASEMTRLGKLDRAQSLHAETLLIGRYFA